MKFTLGILLGLAIGCATTISGQLRFQDRELLIHPDFPGLGYPYKETVCVERTGLGSIFGKKCEKVDRIDTYDLNDKVVREKLINGGFSCTSKMRFKY